MNTLEMLAKFENENEAFGKKEAFELAKCSLKEYTKRSKAAKLVDKAQWDMALAGGCPSAVYSAVIALVERYSK